MCMVCKQNNFLQKIRWVIRSHDTFLTIYVMVIYVWKVNKSKTGHCRPQYTLLALKIMRAYKNISQAWVYYIIVLIYLGAWRYALLPMLDISFMPKWESEYNEMRKIAAWENIREYMTLLPWNDLALCHEEIRHGNWNDYFIYNKGIISCTIQQILNAIRWQTK